MAFKAQRTPNPKHKLCRYSNFALAVEWVCAIDESWTRARHTVAQFRSLVAADPRSID